MNKREKSDNRKALPKFFGIIFLAMVIGLLTGVVMGYLGGMASPETATESVHSFLVGAAPWGMWILGAGLILPELALYRRARKQFAAWDGEDEDIMDRADGNLSWMLLLTSLQLVIAFTLEGIVQILGNEVSFLITLTGFLAALAGCIVMQQKAVDLTRKMNPEKQGSVYDMKFQKKWLDSCDENERRQIGQAAYKSFNVTGGTCIVLWVLLLLLSSVLQTGVLPMIAVMVIWGVSQVSFHLEAMKLSRHR